MKCKILEALGNSFLVKHRKTWWHVYLTWPIPVYSVGLTHWELELYLWVYECTWITGYGALSDASWKENEIFWLQKCPGGHIGSNGCFEPHFIFDSPRAPSRCETFLFLDNSTTVLYENQVFFSSLNGRNPAKLGAYISSHPPFQ